MPTKKAATGIISVFVLAAALFASSGVHAATAVPAPVSGAKAVSNATANAVHERNAVRKAVKKKRIVKKSKKKRSRKAAAIQGQAGTGTSTPETK